MIVWMNPVCCNRIEDFETIIAINTIVSITINLRIWLVPSCKQIAKLVLLVNCNTFEDKNWHYHEDHLNSTLPYLQLNHPEGMDLQEPEYSQERETKFEV